MAQMLATGSHDPSDTSHDVGFKEMTVIIGCGRGKLSFSWCCSYTNSFPALHETDLPSDAQRVLEMAGAYPAQLL